MQTGLVPSITLHESGLRRLSALNRAFNPPRAPKRIRKRPESRPLVRRLLKVFRAEARAPYPSHWKSLADRRRVDAHGRPGRPPGHHPVDRRVADVDAIAAVQDGRSLGLPSTGRAALEPDRIACRGRRSFRASRPAAGRRAACGPPRRLVGRHAPQVEPGVTQAQAGAELRPGDDRVAARPDAPAALTTRGETPRLSTLMARKRPLTQLPSLAPSRGRARSSGPSGGRARRRRRGP